MAGVAGVQWSPKSPRRIACPSVQHLATAILFMNPAYRTDFEAHLEHAARLACILEATARKPGNVHPDKSFADICYNDFVEIATVTAPIVARAGEIGVGRCILEAVQRSQAVTSHNANLGIVLLLAPLAAVPEDVLLSTGIREVLDDLTQHDAELCYRAIRLAQPGGLGKAHCEDVAGTPTVSLRAAMRLAADRDTIAAQYANGFQLVLDRGLSILRSIEDFPSNWEMAIITLHLQLMAEYPDSLIERKCGREVAEQASRRSADVLAAGWPRSKEGRLCCTEFDGWLREAGNRRNPGTTADLIAAVLFAGFRDRLLAEPPFPKGTISTECKIDADE